MERLGPPVTKRPPRAHVVYVMTHHPLTPQIEIRRPHAALATALILLQASSFLIAR